MAVASATLEGNRATEARSQHSRYGCWYADVSLDGEHTLSGKVTLVIADLSMKGSVLAGGPGKGRSEYRIAAGTGWSKIIPRKDYANDAGIKAIDVLRDAAAACGETIDAEAPEILGIKWVRDEGEASRVLERLAPGGWYVGEDGVTRLGARPVSQLAVTATRIEPVDRARGSVTIAAESIASILPGVVVDGLEAIDVEHSVSVKGGLRSTIYGARGASTSRRLAALRALFDAFDPDRNYRAIWEYRVVDKEGKRLTLQPIRKSTGMPDLRRVRVMAGISGAEQDVELGSRVLVTFIDANPAMPIVVAFEDPEGDGFVPILLKLAGGDDFVALAGKVAAQLSALKTALTGAVIVPLDGGASFKASLLTALGSWPASVAASKVKAT